MNDEELDLMLASHFSSIEPSSGVSASVMAAVYAEAAALPPIPFPWRRAIPGLAAAVVGALWGIGELVRLAASSPSSLPGAPLSLPVVLTAGVVASIFTGSLVAAAAATLSMKFVSSRAA